MELNDDTVKLPEYVPLVEESPREFFDRKWIHEPKAAYKACKEANTHHNAANRWEFGCACQMIWYKPGELAYYKRHSKTLNTIKEEYYKDPSAYAKEAKARLNDNSSKQEDT